MFLQHSLSPSHRASIIKFETCPSNCNSLKCIIRPEQAATEFNFLCYSPCTVIWQLICFVHYCFGWWPYALGILAATVKAHTIQIERRGLPPSPLITIAFCQIQRGPSVVQNAPTLPREVCHDDRFVFTWAGDGRMAKKRNCPLFAISLLSFAKTLVWGPSILNYKPEPLD